MKFADILNPTLEISLQIAAACASRKYAATALHNIASEVQTREAEAGRPEHAALSCTVDHGFSGWTGNGRLYAAIELHPLTLMALAQQALAANAPVIRLAQFFDAPKAKKTGGAEPALEEEIPM